MVSVPPGACGQTLRAALTCSLLSLEASRSRLDRSSESGGHLLD